MPLEHFLESPAWKDAEIDIGQRSNREIDLRREKLTGEIRRVEQSYDLLSPVRGGSHNLEDAIQQIGADSAIITSPKQRFSTA